MQEKLKGPFGCLWAIVGFVLLISAVMWLDENVASLGCVKSSLLFLMIFFALVIYRTQLSQMSGRSPKQTGSRYASTGKKKNTSAKKSVDGKKITISRLPKYNPEKDRIAKQYYAPEFIEIIKKGWEFILDEESISMLDESGKEVYALRYDQIYQVTATCGAITPKGGGAKAMLPFPSWAHEYGDESIAIIVERAGLEMAEGKMYRKVKTRQMATKYYTVPPTSLPPKAEKIVDGEKITFKRLPAYDPKHDLYKFSNEAREMSENGWQLIVDVDTLALLDAEGNQLYRVKYADITSQRDYFIWVSDQKLLIPTWATSTDKTLKSTIIERANLVKIKTTQIVGERTTGGMVDREIETFYYGREKQ